MKYVLQNNEPFILERTSGTEIVDLTQVSSAGVSKDYVDTALEGKQDTIDDLSDIRSGAALGATALQSYTETDPTVPAWAKAASKPSYTASEVGALPDTTSIPTETTVSEWGFTKNAGTITGVTMNGTSKGTSGVVNLGTVVTSETDPVYSASAAAGITSTDISNWNAKTDNVGTITGITMNGSSKGTSGVVNLGTVVTSETDPVYSASAAAGITSNDITNWNSKTDNVGTITGITMNGVSKGTSGVVDLGTVLTEHQSLAPYADGTEYDSTNHLIYLKHGNTRLSNPINADDFIKDGMVDTVTIGQPSSGSHSGVDCLIITFNTDAGKTPIEIPLSDIFDPDDYYTKNDIDNAGYLTSETDPVFAASAAHGITASDISNWNSKTSNTGTVTGVKMNGTTNNPTSGVVDLGTVITSETSLSKGTTSGSGNAVTDISVSGHQITLTKGKTFLESETDPVFSASAAAGITSSDITNWNGKTSNTGTVTGVKMNGTTNNPTSGVVDLGTVITSETSLSKGSATGAGNAVTDISVSGHQITLTKGKTFLESESDPVFTASAAYGISSSDITNWNGKTSNTGTITSVKMNGTTIASSGEADLGTVITSETSLSKGTATGAGNAVTDISVNGHQITLTKGKTFLDSETDPVFGASVAAGITSSDITNWNSKTSNTGTVTGVKMNGTTNNPTSGVVDLGTVITSETSLSKGSTSGAGNAVTDISVSGHQITLTKGKTFLESETSLSKGTTTGNGNAVTDISVSGHQITLTKGTTFLTEHQSIKTINNTSIVGTGNVTINALPTVSSTDNGKILQVVNGVWTLVSPVALYSGSGSPSNSLGNDGDLYIQT